MFFKEEKNEMIHGGQKYQKTEKTKFRKNQDREKAKQDKNRHHDKSFYRLIKEEKDSYVL
jgi:hypothetical protein